MVFGMVYDENRTLGDYFDVDNDDLLTSISDTMLNNRAKNVFKRLGCTTIEDICNLKIGDICEANAMGRGTFENVLDFFKSISRSLSVEEVSHEVPNDEDDVAINQHRSQIFDGDFEFISEYNDNEGLKKKLSKYKKAFKVLDKFLVEQADNNPSYVKTLCKAFNDFADDTLASNKILNSIPKYRWKKQARNYIDSYTSNDNNRIIDTIPSCGDGESLYDYLKRTVDHKDKPEYLRFVKWCSESLVKEADELKKEFKNKDRDWEVLTRRSRGETLEQVGGFFGVSRERIRQIEKKGKSKVSVWEHHVKFLELCTADKDDPSLLSEQDMTPFKEIGNVIFYALQDDNSISFTYDKNFNIYLSGIDGSLDDEIAYVESMPDTFMEDEFEKYYKTGLDKDGISGEQLKIVLSEEYKLTGMIYHRHKLSMGKICETIVRKYYPNGIHVHEESETARFKKYVYQEFGDVGGSWTLRSMEANIERVCILRGRGIYMAKKDHYISDELKDKIEAFIDNSDKTIFFINTIYEKFADELIKEGVDNHYYLHGIMKECFGDKYYISRDYVSKDENVGNIREEIVKYVASSKYPLKMSEIKRAFPGVTDIILVLSLGDHDILNFFGSYIYFSRLNLYQHDKFYLRDEIDSLISDNKPHHAKELYERVNAGNPELLRRLGVRYEFALFSVVQRLFEGEYQFLRPYIAKGDVEIVKPEEEIREFVSGEEVVEIDELLSRCEESHYRLATNRLEFFMSFNETHLLADKGELKSIGSIGVSESIAKEIEQMIINEIDETVPIADLRCVVNFPKVNVPWTEQLIYSVLYKWSSKLEVDSSFNMSYENAILLVSPKGKMNNNIFEKSGELAQADDLDNIDELIEDELFKDIKF